MNQSMPPLQLNLGCGHRIHPAWTNVDHSPSMLFRRLTPFRKGPGSTAPTFLYHDLRQPLPFPPASAAAAYASHVLEHLAPADGARLLAEIHRVLRPGGIVRIVVPDLEFVAHAYLESLEAGRGIPGPEGNEARLRHEWAIIQLLDQMVRTEPGGTMTRWLQEHRQTGLVQSLDGVFREIAAPDRPGAAGRLKRAARRFLRRSILGGELHRWMYDDLSLARAFVAAGFRDIRRETFRTSRIPEWPSFGLDGDADGPHHPNSLWMEAARP